MKPPTRKPGGRTSVPCPACQRACAQTASFCSHCGASLRPAPKHDPAPVRSERKFLTIVFVDMVGSLDAIRDADPEEAHELLSATVKLITATVHRHGGGVVRPLGDGVMALFGAPIARENHASSACLAALGIHAAQADANRRDHTGVTLRIGIHSGEVVLAATPHDYSIDYDATGAAVHIAARLQALAPPGTTLLSAATHALVAAQFDTEFHQRLEIRGLNEAIDTIRLLRTKPIGLHPTRTATPLVGRLPAQRRLAAAGRRALAGSGTILGIAGEAGIGKTSLVLDYLAPAPGLVTDFPPDLAILWAEAERHTSVAALLPIRAILQQLFTAFAPAHANDLDLVLRAATALGLAHDEPIMLALFDLFELARPGRQPDRPQDRRRAIAQASHAALEAATRVRPFLIVLENLQQAATATIDILHALVDRIAPLRLLLITTYRSEFSPPWAAHPDHEPIRLHRLPAREAETLAATLLGPAATPTLARTIASRCTGNPLFIAECARALTGPPLTGPPLTGPPLTGPPLTGQDGRDRPLRRILLGDDRLPAPTPTVRNVIAERIDALDHLERDLLLAASVLGETFDLATVAQMTGRRPAAARADLAALTRAGLVRPALDATEDATENVYVFEHSLFQECAYRIMLRERRTELHAAAYRTLRDAALGTKLFPVERLAEHAFGGALWDDAHPLCHQAGRRAAALSSHREAAHHFEHALAALRRSAAAPQRDRAIDLLLELRLAYIPLLRFDKVADILEEAAELARKADDLPRLARITGFLASNVYLTSQADESIAYCRQAIALARRAGDRALEIAPSLSFGQVQYAAGRYRAAIRTFDAAAERFAAALARTDLGLPVRPAIMIRYWAAISRAEIGRFAAALTLIRGALEADAKLTDFESVYARTALGFIHMLQGDLAPALEASQNAAAIADERDLLFFAPVLGSQLGCLLAATGRVAEGVRRAERALRSAEAIGAHAGQSRWCARLAETYLQANRPGDALPLADRAVQLAQSTGELGYLCSGLYIRARIRAALDPATAPPDLTAALDLARGLRLGPMVAKLRLQAARLEPPTLAAPLLASAARLFTRYAMTQWAHRCHPPLPPTRAAA